MTGPFKILLATAIAGLTAQSIIACYGYSASPLAPAAVWPLGIIPSGLLPIWIWFIIDKEADLYDREQARILPGSPSNAAPAPIIKRAFT